MTERPNRDIALRYWNDLTLKAWHWQSDLAVWRFCASPDFHKGSIWHVGHEAPTEPPVKTCELVGIKFPMPIVKEPELGTVVWVACADGIASKIGWSAVALDRSWLIARLLHTTEAAAQAQSAALHEANLQAIEGAK